jgi:branched-chain amino acid transport system substrate-binding protein
MRIFGILAAVVLCSMSSLSATASVPSRPTRDSGVSTRSIKVGGIIDQTGRGTVISKPLLAGYELALKEINGHGGVNGRTIDFNALSDNYDPSQTLQQAKQLVESDKVFAVMGVFGSDDVNVAAPYLEGQHVPFFDPVGGGVDIAGKHWIWQTEPDYAREGKVMARYAGSTLHAKRVAVLYQVGIGETQRDALKATLPKFGAQLVGTASYQSTDSNLSGQVLKLKGANPDLIVLNGTPTPTTAFLQYARLLNFKPKYGFIANYPMGDPLWLTLIGSNGEGNHVTSYADLTGKNVVARAYRKAIAKYHGEAYSNYGLYGYFNASLFCKALKMVGKNVTRARLQTVLDTRFRHYVTGFTGKLDWTPKQHYGSRQFKVYRIHNDAFLPVTPWINP